MENLAEGDLFGAITSGIVGGIQILGKLFTDTEKQINPVRQAFVDMHGGLDALNRKAQQAGVTLRKLLDAKNPKAYEAAIRDLQEAFEFQNSAMQTLDQTVQKYKFSLEELGPALRMQELDKQAQGLFKDWQILAGAGIDLAAIGREMQVSINDFIQRAVATGTEVPAAMRPMLQSMIDMGLLTDAAGNVITSLEESGISFSQTMTEGFKSIVDEVKRLTEAIARGLGLAIESLPTHVPIDFEMRGRLTGDWNTGGPDVQLVHGGGRVTARGVQKFAGGGRVLPFLRRGMDTVPAMLTPGEMVLNESQQREVSSALNMTSAALSTASLERKLDALNAGMARDRALLPKTIARYVKEAVQTAGGRR
jgi:hypothetical protein